VLFEVWCLGAYGRYHPEAACINCLHTDISRRCIAAATTDASLAEAIALMQMQMQMQSSECSLVCAGHVLHSVEPVWVVYSITFAAVHHSSTEDLTQ
jgi:hypothetical protein